MHVCGNCALVMVGGNMLRRIRNCLSYYYYCRHGIGILEYWSVF